MTSLEATTAPRFSLRDQDGNTVSPAQWKGAPVVLYFYPQDDTPTCTKQACTFRDTFEQYQTLGARVVGVSTDTSDSHRKFAAKYGLPFTLLADPEHKACEAYGVWREKTMFGRKYMGIVRTTFVIDAGGKIRKVFPNVRVKGHSEAVLSTVRELQGPRRK